MRMGGNVYTIRPDMAAAISAEMHRRGVSDLPGAHQKPALPEGVKMALIGAAGGLAWAFLLGAGLLCVI